MNEMNLYLWQLENEDCTCYYGIVEKSLIVAREKIVESLNIEKSFCVSCLSLDGKDWSEMSFEEKRQEIETKLANSKEMLIKHILTSEPIIHPSGTPFQRI